MTKISNVTIRSPTTSDQAEVILADGQDGLVTVTPGHVSTDNSTSTPLGGGAVFTGTSEEVVNHGIIVVAIFSDVASATDGLQIEFSTDNTNWDHLDNFTIPAGTGKTFSFQTVAQYFRIVYTNGVAAQSVFRLQTVLKPAYVKPSSHRIADSISSQDDAELVKSVLTAEDPNGVFVNIQATDSDNLRVTDAESGLAIAKGDVAGTTFVHKFGNAPDIDTADLFVDIWDGVDAALGTGKIANYTFSTTADIDSLSSSDNTDTQDIEVQGLDTNFDLVTQTITLTGQTRKALDTSLIRVFRMINRGSTDFAGDVYCYVNGSITLGVPDTAADVRAVVNNGNNQTLMAIYTVPNGKTGYMRTFYSSMSKRQAATSVIHILARPDGEVFQLKHVTSIASTGTSHVQHFFEEPEVFAAKTDIIMRADTSANDTGVGAGFDIVLVDD